MILVEGLAGLFYEVPVYISGQIEKCISVYMYIDYKSNVFKMMILYLVKPHIKMSIKYRRNSYKIGINTIAIDLANGAYVPRFT